MTPRAAFRPIGPAAPATATSAARPRPGNLGATAQRCRRRSRDPMAAFDALPPPLRRWLASAALPWSPASVLRLWLRLRRRGLSKAEALAALDRAETRALLREAGPGVAAPGQRAAA